MGTMISIPPSEDNMAWGKESYDEFRSLNVNLKTIENLFCEILHQITKDSELKFWERCVVSCANGILCNDGAGNVYRPDNLATIAGMMADSLLDLRRKKIEELDKRLPENEDTI